MTLIKTTSARLLATEQAAVLHDLIGGLCLVVLLIAGLGLTPFA